jgi:hypothetical protein
MPSPADHEFRPLPDRPAEEQVELLSELLNMVSQNSFELRMELNELKEQNESLRSEVEYYRSIVGAEARNNFNTQSKN